MKIRNNTELILSAKKSRVINLPALEGNFYVVDENNQEIMNVKNKVKLAANEKLKYKANKASADDDLLKLLGTVKELQIADFHWCKKITDFGLSTLSNQVND